MPPTPPPPPKKKKKENRWTHFQSNIGKIIDTIGKSKIPLVTDPQITKLHPVGKGMYIVSGVNQAEWIFNCMAYGEFIESKWFYCWQAFVKSVIKPKTTVWNFVMFGSATNEMLLFTMVSIILPISDRKCVRRFFFWGGAPCIITALLTYQFIGNCWWIAGLSEVMDSRHLVLQRTFEWAERTSCPFAGTALQTHTNMQKWWRIRANRDSIHEDANVLKFKRVHWNYRGIPL